MRTASRAALVTGLTFGMLSLASPAGAAPHNDCYHSNGENLYAHVQGGEVVLVGAGPEGYAKARKTTGMIARRSCYEPEWRTLNGVKMSAEGSVKTHWSNHILRWLG